MKLIGSRASGKFDALSDWDHVLETSDDFITLNSMIESALCVKYDKKSDIHLLTLIDLEFNMHDFSDATNKFTTEWEEILTIIDSSEFSEFWILAVKHLKGIYRNYLLLIDLGIELSLKILRDKFVSQHFGVENYYDFFAFKKLGTGINKTLAPLFDVTGLPTHTKLERIEKLRAINALYAKLTPERSGEIQQGIDNALARLRDHELVQAAARNHQSWFSETSDPTKEALIAFPKTDEIDIDGVLASARDTGVEKVGCWSLLPTMPTDLGARLLARGFTWGWQPHWMALDLSQTLPETPAPGDLEIRENVGGDAWDVENLPYYDPAAPLKLSERTSHFGAWQDGRVVGQSAVHLSESDPTIAGIYNVGVVPEARRRGVGRAISRAACEWARARGCRYVLLNAATHIYEKLGFRSLGYGQTWWLHAPLPTEAVEIVEFVEAIGRGDVAALETLPCPPLDAMLACKLTPLELTARLKQPGSAQWLLDRGATPHVLALYDLGWAKSLPRLLAERPELLNRRRGIWGATPLHEAVERDDLELTKLLLAASPDLTLKDHQFHGTPLGWATHLGRTRLIPLLEAYARKTFSHSG